MEQTFTKIYETFQWGNNKNALYRGSSGDGSSIQYNENEYIPFLKQFIITNDIKSISDLGCGDFRCGRLLYDDLDIQYTGYDVYSKIIDHNNKTTNNDKYLFIHCDFSHNIDQINKCDLIIIKDVLQHWDNTDITTFLDKLIQKQLFKYILICNCNHQKHDNQNLDSSRFRPLTYTMMPLKKYNPVKLLNYKSKEISVIYQHNL